MLEYDLIHLILYHKKATANNSNQRVGGPSGFIQVRQNLMAPNNSNTIDLTDEDDPKPKVQNAPTLVALNNRNRSQIVSQPQIQRQQIAATARATIMQPRAQRPNGNSFNL